MAKASKPSLSDRGGKILVFIGSSKEASCDDGPLDKVAGWLSESGHQVLRWNDNKAFPLGSATWPQLVETAGRVDAAIMIFSGEDKTVTRGKAVFKSRDNIYLEYGLFSGIFSHKYKDGDNRCIILKTEEKSKLPTDLNVDYGDMRDEQNCRNKIKLWANFISEQIAKNGISEIDKIHIKIRLAEVIKQAGFNDPQIARLLRLPTLANNISITTIFDRYDEKLANNKSYTDLKKEIIKIANLKYF